MRVILVRHAHTTYNVLGDSGRFCGRSDPSLSQRGIGEAAAVADALREEHPFQVFSSSLCRAKETAKALGRKRVIEVKRLDEIDYGAWEGLTKREVRSNYPDVWAAFRNEPYLTTTPGGESAADVLARATAALTEFSQSGTMVLVGHKTVWRLLLCGWLHRPLESYREIELRLGSISIAEGNALDALRLVTVNGIDHLGGAEP